MQAKPLSEEQKKKLSDKLTGRKLTQEHRDNIRKNGSCGRKSPESYKKGLETRRKNREMSEWLKELVLKTSDVQASAGSNPALSARTSSLYSRKFFVTMFI